MKSTLSVASLFFFYVVKSFASLFQIEVGSVFVLSFASVFLTPTKKSQLSFASLLLGVERTVSVLYFSLSYLLGVK